MSKFKRHIALRIIAALSILGALLLSHTGVHQSLAAPSGRALTITQLSGDVEYLTATQSRPAVVGDQLTSMGDGVHTGSNASMSLKVDSTIGTITLRENTEVRVKRLAFALDNGRITHLYVPEGQVNLNLRPFTHAGSQLDVETPSGVSGVRGTEFGVLVQPNGATGVATRSGEVAAMAQAKTVVVQAGYQTLIRPDSPPATPTQIPQEPLFEYRIERIVRQGQRILLLIGKIDPINQAYVNGELQVLKPWGEFGYQVLARRSAQVKVTVVTPLGDETEYDISLL